MNSSLYFVFEKQICKSHVFKPRTQPLYFLHLDVDEQLPVYQLLICVLFPFMLVAYKLNILIKGNSLIIGSVILTTFNKLYIKNMAYCHDD